MGAAVRGAAIYGHEGVLECLLARKADPDALSLSNRTALMGAAMHGHTDCVQLLLQASATIGLKNDHGETALDLATAKGHRDVVLLLSGSLTAIEEEQVVCTLCGGFHAYWDCDCNVNGFPDSLEEFDMAGVTGGL